MAELLLKDEVYAVVGAAFDVYNELGSGYNEPIYQEAYEIELEMRGVNFEAQKKLPISYKGRVLKKHYVPDVICFGCLIVELKVLPALTSREDAQVLGYLKATGLRVAVLINFGNPEKLEWKRIVL